MRLRRAAVGIAVATMALLVTPGAGLAAKQPKTEGSLTITGAHTFHHVETNDSGDCTATHLLGPVLAFQADYDGWIVGLGVEKLSALSKVNLATAENVEVISKHGPYVWGAGHMPLKAFDVHGASGHVTTTKGDLSGTVTATLTPAAGFGGHGTLHLKATWHCSRVYRN